MTIKKAVELYERVIKEYHDVEKLYEHLSSSKAQQANAAYPNEPTSFEFKLSPEDTRLLLSTLTWRMMNLESQLNEEFYVSKEEANDPLKDG